MALQPSFADSAPSASMEGEESAKPTYRSYRKKYRKMKHRFEEKMKESGALFKEEQRALEIAKRLQEQNDQLLDLLLDVNQASRLPRMYRVDLTSMAHELLQDPYDLELGQVYDAKAKVEKAKVQLAAGDITQESYNELEANLQSQEENVMMTMITLLGVPHTRRMAHDPDQLPDILRTETVAGYLTPAHMEDYLFNLDNAINPTPIITRPSATIDHLRLGEKGSPKDREMATKNPVSVYNWLRKNEPQVFLQDNEGNLDKHVKAPSSKAAKRSTVTPKVEPEALEDEFGLIPEIGGSSRAKRKRDDEPYRPKGGSSRPAKRKRDDGDKGSKKVRKIAAASNGG